MTMPEVVDFITRYAHEIAAPGARRHDGDVGTCRRRWVPRRRPTKANGSARPSCSQPARSTCPECPTSPRRCRRPSRRSRRWSTAIRTSSPRAACWSSAHRRPACRSPTRSSARAARSRLAVGEHVRGPRVYRGRDIHWWMEASGVLDERYDEVDDIVRARAACRRCSWRVLRRGRRSTSTRSPTSA